MFWFHLDWWQCMLLKTACLKVTSGCIHGVNKDNDIATKLVNRYFCAVNTVPNDNNDGKNFRVGIFMKKN